MSGIRVLVAFLAIPTFAWGQLQPPIANAGTNMTVYVDTDVQLNGTATDPNGLPIVGWNWVVISAPAGAGNPLNVSNVSSPLFYGTVVGQYYLGLTVTDGTLWSPESVVIITVVPVLPPVAVINATPTNGTAPLTVQFDGTQSSDPQGWALQYYWILGDGNISTSPTPTATYTIPGTWEVVLLVTDPLGASDETNIIIKVLQSATVPPVKVTTSTIDGGGLRTSSANYTMDGSVGGIGGISSAAADTAKNGYIGQLTEVVSLTATGTPASVNQGATSQLSGSATMDDTTVTTLTGSDIDWGIVTYPFQSVDSDGVLTAAANVYASPVGTVNGYYLGATSNASVQVLGPYANSSIADSWLVQYFGMPPNPNAAPTVDADGTGQNNLFKYVAGLNPTNPASVFVLLVQNVPGQPTQKNLLFSPVVGGRTYTPQFRTDMVTSAWATLTGFSGPATNVPQAQVTLTDLSATQTQKFYRVNISLP